MFSDFERVLKEDCGLNEPVHLIAGVSGGPDSQSLLHLLVNSGMEVTVAHFNHGLRPEADADEQAVRAMALELGCHFVRGSADVRLIAAEQKQSIETAARKARYRFLFDQAVEIHAAGVAVGHNADDQVETLLLHLLRGSGLDGLRGMRFRSFLPEFSADIPLLRPLLSYWRTDILEYCRQQNLRPLMDATNQDVKYTRNRIRQELLPELQTYNPQVKQRLWTLSQVAGGSLDALEDLVESSYQTACREEGQGFVALNGGILEGFQSGMIELVFRRAARRLEPEPEDLTWERLRIAGRAVLDHKHNGKIDLADDLSVVYCQERVYLAVNGTQIVESSWPAFLSDKKATLPVPGQVELANGYVIRIEQELVNQADSLRYVQSDPNQAWLDGGTIENILNVGPAGAYRRFQPLGMDSGSLSLGDYFTNKKLPRPARAIWPVVADDERVVWVPGYAPAHSSRVTTQTHSILHLHLIREGK